MKTIITFIFLSFYISHGQNVVTDSIPYNDGYRMIRLYLPDGYQSQERPLLYMLDGQNLFDDKTSYAGEWNIDETIASFKNEKQAIVIAIDHGNELRIEELTPFKHEKYGGGKADEFLAWIMNKVKPTIIDKYNMKINHSKIAIAGSSLGGLFAHYAALKHPYYFSTAGVLSPSYWFSDKIYELSNQYTETHTQQFIFMAGTEESDDMIPDMKKMHDLMFKKMKKGTVSYTEFDHHKHNEAQWREAFPLFYLSWLENKPHKKLKH